MPENETKGMKIALLDLNHTTCGIHTNTVPLGLGLIATYLKKTVGHDFDIRLFKETDKILATLKSWTPDVIGIAQYAWNSELNLFIAKMMKGINPKCIVVAGGPNLEISSNGKYEFLKRHEYVDIGVEFDGEIPFATIVRRLISGESINEIRIKPSAGTYSIDVKTNELAESKETPPRLESLDVLGTVYADGVFDEFLKDGYHPFVQTARGCPFSCAYCHTSNPYHSRIVFLSPDIFRKDMEYLAKIFAGRHDVTLYIANTNMSLYNEDFTIARIIREIQEKYDWPTIFQVDSGKDPKKLLEMMSILRFNPGIALQTLTPSVLKNINRLNIPFESYSAFQQKMLDIGICQTSLTELILSLPGETKESFLETLKTVINSGVQKIVIYTLMKLKGTPLASEEFSKRYGYVVKHRVVPRQFSTINGEKVFDTEEVIIGTNEMPFEDYLELRGISFVVTAFFSSAELVPLKKFLIEYGIDLAKWVFNIHTQLKNYPDLHSQYQSFLEETKNELFPSKDALIEFYSKPENYDDLIDGKRGDNLLRKYKCTVLMENFPSFLKLATAEARKLTEEKLGKRKAEELVGELEKYLSTFDMKPVLLEHQLPVKNVNLTFDIPEWLNEKKKRKLLEEFRGAHRYTAAFAPDTLQKIEKFKTMNKDFILSFQILYRDGTIMDMWPRWIPSKPK